MRNNILPRLFVFCLILGAKNINTGLLAANSGHDSITIKKCKDFKITGDGVSDPWKSTNWITLLQQDTNTLSYKTKVKVLYSETGIYFLFNCEDKKLTSSMKADNLNLWEEDVVEVFLWTDENFPVYFEYELSPFNFELPILVPNNKGNFLGWLPWHYEGDRRTQHTTSVTGGKMESGSIISGWIAEFFIPYKLLTPLSHVPPVTGTRWRANMYRIDYDNGEVPYAWQKTSQTFHEYNKFGTFIFD
jgi:Carbohydrate family 9 binding domain-like